MLILRVVGLIVKALVGLVIFLYLLSFAGLLKKQYSVTQSTTEAEYVATASCYSQILWIVHTMRDFGVSFKRVSLMCNNISTISVARNPVFHKKIRHYKRRHHFLRDHVK
jgi:hypothetical protein